MISAAVCPALRRADVLDAAQELVEIVERAVGVCEALVIEHETLDDIFPQPLGGPDAELGGDAGILDGDTVVVEKRGAAVGDIVVAIVDNAFTLKILAREKGRFVLRPANKAYAVIRPREDLEIFGVVTGLFRKYGAGVR